MHRRQRLQVDFGRESEACQGSQHRATNFLFRLAIRVLDGDLKRSCAIAFTRIRAEGGDYSLLDKGVHGAVHVTPARHSRCSKSLVTRRPSTACTRASSLVQRRRPSTLASASI